MAELAQVSPAQIRALRNRMRMTQTEFGEILRVRQHYVSQLESGDAPVADNALRVLVLWLMSVFGVEGGQTPHPSVPLVIAPAPAATVRRTGGRGPYRLPDDQEPGPAD